MDWDLTSYFSEFNAPDYQEFKATLLTDLEQLSVDLDRLEEITEGKRSHWALWICQLEDLESRFEHLGSYLSCLNAADAHKDEYQQEEALHQENSAGLSTINARFGGALGRASETVFNSQVNDPKLVDAGFLLQEKRNLAQFQMDDASEALASEMNIHGISA